MTDYQIQRDDAIRELHILYCDLARHGPWPDKYPKRRLMEFSRWWESQDVAGRAELTKRIRADYEEMVKIDVDRVKPMADRLIESILKDSEAKGR